jgi:hypothetical protein
MVYLDPGQGLESVGMVRLHMPLASGLEEVLKRVAQEELSRTRN